MLTVWWPAYGSEWEELRPQVIQRFLVGGGVVVGEGDAVQLREVVQVPFVSVDVRLTLLQAFLRLRERAELLWEKSEVPWSFRECISGSRISTGNAPPTR